MVVHSPAHSPLEFTPHKYSPGGGGEAEERDRGNAGGQQSGTEAMLGGQQSGAEAMLGGAAEGGAVSLLTQFGHKDFDADKYADAVRSRRGDAWKADSSGSGGGASAADSRPANTGQVR